jgi:cytochrome c oxidase cbb3-type subunit 3
MKRILLLLGLTAAIGLLFYQSRIRPIYAASGGPQTNAATPNSTATTSAVPSAQSSAAADAGAKVYQQNCTFCHGRDAMGGESGPDLTRSKLVHDDVGGDKIGEVVRLGRNGDKKMPAFNLSGGEMVDLVAFLHRTAAAAAKMSGNRKGVDVSDLQTGNVEAGKRYFNGAGTCSTCHSPTGDLAGVATRYKGLELEQRMLYPRKVLSGVVVTLPSGETIAGTLAYKDEFVIGMHDSSGTYHSWKVSGHVDLLPKYTDADIHDLMAYIQTLR